MSYTKFDHGPLDVYEIMWNSGHVEYIDAHQVLAPRPAIFGDDGSKVWMFHGEVDGRWRLLLTASDDDIRSVRNVTHTRDTAQAGEQS